MNADLPQFNVENPSNGWTEISSTYDVSAFLFSVPVAIQIFTKDGRRSVTTGLLTGTWDEFEAKGEDDWTLARSIFSFQDAEDLSITWAQVHGVLVMVATPVAAEGGEADVN